MMKRLLRTILTAFVLVLSLQSVKAAESAPVDSVDEAVATFIVSNFRITLDNALADLARTGLKFDADAVRRMVFARMADDYDAEAHRRAAAFIENAVESIEQPSDSLLAAAAARPGAVRTPSGLVFETLADGVGPSPVKESTVTIRYRVALPDGTVVDEIAEGDEPMTARATDLTPGFTEGLMMMNAGGRYLLTMPAALAYGEQGIPGVIPPGCALQFDVELVKFE